MNSEIELTSSVSTVKSSFEELELKSSSENKKLTDVDVDRNNWERKALVTHMALAIDHILEQILNSLKMEDLAKCFQVNYHWRSAVMEIICKRFHHKLTLKNFKIQSPDGKWWKELGLKELNDLIKYQNCCEVKEFPFRCRKFEFREGDPGSNFFTEFFDLYGSSITELTLRKMSNSKGLTEKFLMEHIRNLIVNQAPNLHFLFLDLYPEIQWVNFEYRNNFDHIRGDYSTIRLNDPEFIEIHGEDLSQIPVNTSLRVLKMGGRPSAKLLEVIIRLAPNLQEIILDRKDMYLLLRPLNRIRFIKKLYLSPIPMDNLERFKEIVKLSHEEKLELREFEIDFRHSSSYRRHDDLTFPLQFIEIINRIFECISESLEILKLFGLPALRDLQLPKVLPNVWKLELGNPDPPNTWPELTEIENNHNFNLSKTFPKLRCIHLYNFRKDVGVLEFITSLNFDPVETVEEVKIWDSDGKPVLVVAFKELIYRLFPKASCGK